MLISFPSENRMAAATCTVNTGTPDPEYPPENLIDLQPQIPAKLLTNDGSFVASLGASLRVARMVLVMHNFYGASSVRLQGHASNLWTSPTFDQAVTIPAPHMDGQPVNATLNLDALGIGQTFAYWRIIVAGNTNPIALGEWRLEADQHDVEVLWEDVQMLERPAIIHNTEVKVRKEYNIGTAIRSLTAEMMTSVYNAAQMEQHFRDAFGVVKPFTVVPDPTATSEPMLMKWLNVTHSRKRRAPEANTVTVEFIEVNRGGNPNG